MTFLGTAEKSPAIIRHPHAAVKSVLQREVEADASLLWLDAVARRRGRKVPFHANGIPEALEGEIDAARAERMLLPPG